ncbi:MAG: hypothetical protein AAB262_09175 [Elusimicrobiota bacterium]
MGRLFMKNPHGMLVAEFDGSDDAQLIGLGARHGHPLGTFVNRIDYEAGTFGLENDDGTVGRSEPIPSWWFEVEDDASASPVLVIHDGDAVTRVAFVPYVEPAP